MENKIEQIINNIEQSFEKLNNSVEQLNKAKEISSKSVQTTSKLIKEFSSSVKSIEDLIKIDFANEYNKLENSNNNMIKKIDKIDFEGKLFFIKNLIDDKTKEIYDFANANNEILDFIQHIINSLPDKLDNIKKINNSNSNLLDTVLKNQVKIIKLLKFGLIGLSIIISILIYIAVK